MEASFDAMSRAVSDSLRAEKYTRNTTSMCATHGKACVWLFVPLALIDCDFFCVFGGVYAVGLLYLARTRFVEMISMMNSIFEQHLPTQCQVECQVDPKEHRG